MSDIVIITRFPADFNVLGGRPARRWFQRRTGCTAVLSVPPQDGGGSTQ
ncbi:hypothetical protein HMPREF9193_01907 [Treponema lecithinolyticum ATCC 700332]|uniref:Uncharacterized protein n=1 Tax=Treponema lecithinolyticum ATCC 700332 TaxID=1321815 RepID=A0ABN0NWU9_TRELE|nr:hypothetical protein HMPREF9193_01907 [Treponema lecithinolyticum ATCC 700332]